MLGFLIPYLTGREAPAAPKKPGAQRVLASPEVRSTKTLSRSKGSKVRRFRGGDDPVRGDLSRKKNVSVDPQHTLFKQFSGSSFNAFLKKVSKFEITKKKKISRSRSTLLKVFFPAVFQLCSIGYMGHRIFFSIQLESKYNHTYGKKASEYFFLPRVNEADEVQKLEG